MLLRGELLKISIIYFFQRCEMLLRRLRAWVFGWVGLCALLNPAVADRKVDFFRVLELDRSAPVLDYLRQGFSPNVRNANGQPALVYALHAQSPQVALILAKANNLEVEARNLQDESPLMMAALRGYLEVAKLLIERQADVNKPGWTPLHYAASGDSDQALAMIHLLLQHHAYIDAASPNGTTALMMAARYGRQDVVALLLDEGADVALKNQLGFSALDFARQAGRDEVQELIAQAIRKKQSNRARW